MATVNQQYFDASVRHQVGVQRYTSGEVKRIVTFLSEVDRDLVTLLRKRLPKVGSFTSRRAAKLLQDVRDLRDAGMKVISKELSGDLVQFGKLEAAFEDRILASSLPIEVNFAAVSARQIREIVFQKPLQGRLLRDWFKGLQTADRARVEQAIQLGLAEGEAVPQMVRRLTGTRAAGYSDGILAISRRNAEAVVRTAANHVSNAARSAFRKENSDVIEYELWVSVLDGRTTPICRARDGLGSPIGDKPLPKNVQPLEPPGATPPAHFRCRSTKVGVVDPSGLVGDRPYVRDTRTRRERENAFRREARRTGEPVKDVRRRWADAQVGRVPAKQTYNQWLKRQPAGFQDEVLGRTKGKLFRQGGLDVQQYVDRRGGELTLDQLAKTRPEAFVAAGLEPEAFLN